MDGDYEYQYKLMRDGVSDKKLYFQHELYSVQSLKPISYKTNAVEDPQESVENVAVVAGSSVTPVKEEEANTTDNDISPQQAPTVATLPPPPSALDNTEEDDSETTFGELILARTEVETPVSTNGNAIEMSDRREVTAEEGYYQRTAIEDSAYGTASHGQSSGVKVALPTDAIAVEQQIDDLSTEYSETSVTESRNHSYMEYLADDLYAVASKVQYDPQSIQTLSGILPELLQQFALRIGQEVSRKDGREVMYYVHKHRK